MKKIEKIISQLNIHLKEKSYIRITRGVKKNFRAISTGYIIDVSEKFTLINEVDEFMISGYNIIPLNKIKSLRYNENDKYSNNIYKSEFSIEKLTGIDTVIDLNSWRNIFQDLKKLDKTIISECEKFKHGYFAIGKINSVNNDAVYIDYFNAQGVKDDEPVEHKFKWITKVTFDDNYSKVFSKYIKKVI